ncbi:hypothetical protein KKA95_01995 [Patescibacteria group bacterium]|nr:hypothetical protein [Patescibacteria group bacterium]
MPPLLPPKIELAELNRIMQEEAEILDGNQQVVRSICRILPIGRFFARDLDNLLQAVRRQLAERATTPEKEQEANLFIHNVRTRVDEDLLGITD